MKDWRASRPRRNRTVLRIIIGAVLALAFVGSIPDLAAHTPHDIVRLIRVSPTYPEDRTVVALVQLSDHRLLCLSEDGGRTFRQFATPFTRFEVADIVFSPRFAADRTAYAACPSRKPFVTRDGGRSWVPLRGAPHGLASIAVSPSFETDRTIAGVSSGDCFVSSDAGESWDRTDLSIEVARPLAVRFAADEAGAHLLALCRRERADDTSVLIRSDDRGRSWREEGTVPALVSHLVVSPGFADDRTVVSHGAGTGVLVSTDAGHTWRPANDGLTDLAVNEVVIAADGTLFAVTKTDGCFRAERAGAPWTLVDRGFERHTHQTDDHYVTVAVSPGFADDRTVFVGMFEGFFKSTDGGDEWITSDIYGAQIPRALSLSPNFAEDGTIFVGSYGAGPIVSTDRGRSWAARADGLNTLYTSVLEPGSTFATDGTLFYAHEGLWSSVDLGRTWIPSTFDATRGIPRAIGVSPDFAEDGTMFIGTTKGNVRTVDGGETWQLMRGLPKGVPASRILVSPEFATDRTVWFATKRTGVWRSEDAGTRWHAANGGMPRQAIRTLELSPTHATTDGSLACSLLAGTPTGLFRSDDGGDSWRHVITGIPERGRTPIQSIAWSPAFAEDRTVFVSTQRFGVFRSDDGGESFTTASAGLPLDCPRLLAISPAFAEDRTLYLGTHDWIWVTRDAGERWSKLPGLLRIDDRHHSIQSIGAWEEEDGAGACGPGVMVSRTAGDEVRLEFEGRSIEWHAAVGPGGGTASVIVDDTDAVRVDLKSGTPESPRPVFVRRFDADGRHTIRVVHDAPADEAAPPTVIRSDGFSFEFGVAAVVRGTATRAFRTEEVDGEHRFVKPDGSAFVALGVNHTKLYVEPEVGDDEEHDSGSGAPTLPDDERARRIDKIAADLASWDFNCAGYGAPPEIEARLPFMSQINSSLASRWRPDDQFAYGDVFDPDEQLRMQRLVRDACVRARENENLIGYFWTASPEWDIDATRKRRGTDWVSALRNGAERAPGRMRYVRFLDRRYLRDPVRLGEAYGIVLDEFAQILTYDFSDLDLTRQAVREDDEQFLGIIAEEYYRVLAEATREHDPDHLILGERYSLNDAPDVVLRAALPYVDVVSVQHNSERFAAARFDAVHALTQKPVLICDHAITFPTPEYPRTIWRQVADEATAAAAHADFLEDAFARPYVIGYLRCQYVDRPEDGGRLLRQGLLRADEAPYEALIEAARAANREVMAHRIGEPDGD